MSDLIHDDPKDSGQHEIPHQIEAAMAKLPLPQLVEIVVGQGVVLADLYCPFHATHTPSVRAWQTEDGHWQWRCSAGCGAGDEIAFLAAWNEMDPDQATKEYLRLASEVGKSEITNQDAPEETVCEETADEQKHDSSAIRRAKKYVAKMRPAIAHEVGHNKLFAVACVLVKKFELPVRDVWEVLLEYNLRCEPPWSKGELVHKLANAYAKVGNALCEQELLSQLPDPPATQVDLLKGPIGQANLVNISRCVHGPATGLLAKPKLDGIRPLTYPEMVELSSLRRIPFRGILYAAHKEFMFGVDWHGQRCFGVKDQSGQIIELRRLDGKPFPAVPKRGLDERKSHAVKHSNKTWPLGILEAAAFSHIALVEGIPDFLYAHWRVVTECAQERVAVVAMLSATPAISEAACSNFSGKTVRIFPHLDGIGLKAAERWQRQLVEHGATNVDIFDLSNLKRADGTPVEDLCDLTAMAPEQLNADPELQRMLP